jgi:very-short-patch-repair endonuclease
MPNITDWQIVCVQLWYRIPVVSAPKNIKEGNVEYIAFYFPANFGAERKWKVSHYAKVKTITEVSRKELFPKESKNSKSEKHYYKISFDNLETLAKPFASRRGHRIVFVSTTKEKFFSGSTDFNVLFPSSTLEKKMEEILDKMEMEYEREWRVNVDVKKFYFLDFAVWCKNGRINVECDGDAYHMENDKVHYDKTRNNELESYGWSVFRFTTKHFKEEPQHIESILYKKVRELGGSLKVSEPNEIYLPKRSDERQMGLF